MENMEKMMSGMADAGLNKNEIKEICDLENSFLAECEEIAEQCEAEGYPAHGSNYDLRVENARRFYDEQIDLISRGRW